MYGFSLGLFGRVRQIRASKYKELTTWAVSL